LITLWKDEMPNQITIVDVDGTIFEQWTNRPIQGAKEALENQKNRKNSFIVYVTGRVTNPEQAIRQAGFPCDTVIYRGAMPINTWIWSNALMKERVLTLFKQLGIVIIEAFDNDPDNIEMYERNGVRAVLVTGSDTWKNLSF
jgi:hypothetical protein